MDRRSQLMWGVSGLLLAWIGVMAIVSGRNAACAREGQRFNITAWACESSGPPILLQRDLQRG